MREVEALFNLALKSNKPKKGKFTLLIGTVKAIEGDTCTVDDYEDVRLNAIIENLESHYTIYPKVGSKVVIARLDDEDDMFVVRFSEIDKVTIKINDQLFEMNGGKFTIKNGNADLKAILNDGFQQLKNAIITTPSGPGKFSPADKAVFENLKTKTNQLLS